MRIAVAAASLFTAGATTEPAPAPQLVINRAQPMQHWTSAADAPLYASANAIDRIDFWDSRDGTLLRTVNVRAARAQLEFDRSPPPVVLSDDGRLAATVANDRITLIFTSDGRTDTPRASVNGFPQPLNFSPDGRTLAVDDEPTPGPSGLRTNGSVALVSTANGASVPIPGGETDAAFSPDGHSVATLPHARDHLMVFDTRRGTIRSLSDGGGVYGPLAFSPDGMLVASLGDDPSIPPDGKGIFVPNATDHDLVVKLWDLRRGRLLARLPWHAVSNRFTLDEHGAGAFAFGAGHTLAVSTTTQTVVYDTISLDVSGRLPHRNNVSYENARQAATPYRSDGRLTFVTEDAVKVAFTHWTGSSEALDATIPFAAIIGNIAIDRVGRTLAIAGVSPDESDAARDGAYALDLTTLRWTVEATHQKSAKPIFFLTDGRLALPSLCELLYVNLSTRKNVRHDVPGGLCAYPFPDFSLSANGQVVFLGTDSGLLSPPNAVPETIPLRAYDVATGRRRYEAPGTTGLPLACAWQSSVCVFPERTTTPNLGHQHDPVTLAVVETTTGKRRRTFGLHALIGGAAFVDSDRRLIVRETAYTNVETDTIDVIDPLHGKLERQFRCNTGAIAFAPLSDVFSITDDAATTIFNTAGVVENTIANTIEGSSDNVTFFPDGSKLAIVAPDGTIAVRATRSGRLLLTLTFFSGQNGLDWLAYTPDGDYDGSTYAVSTIRWRVGDRTLPGSAFSERFHRPDVVTAALR